MDMEVFFFRQQRIICLICSQASLQYIREKDYKPEAFLSVFHVIVHLLWHPSMLTGFSRSRGYRNAIECLLQRLDWEFVKAVANSQVILEVNGHIFFAAVARENAQQYRLEGDVVLKYSAQSELIHFKGRLYTVISSCRSLYCHFCLVVYACMYPCFCSRSQLNSITKAVLPLLL